MCMNDKAGGGSGSPVVLYTCNGGTNELWSHNSHGAYVLKARPAGSSSRRSSRPMRPVISWRVARKADADDARPVTTLCPAQDRSAVVTTVRIAHTEPWPGKRMGGRGFRISSFLVVLADDAGGRALPLWLNGPEGHGLFRGDGSHPHPEPAEVITAGLLRVADVTVTGVDIDELNAALTTGPGHGRDLAQAAARIEFTAACTAEPRHLPVRIGYALAMAAATGAPVRVADQLMDQLAVPAQGDLVDQFTRDVSLPRRRRGLRRLFRGHPQVRLAAR
jgi:hypothetical protein